MRWLLKPFLECGIWVYISPCVGIAVLPLFAGCEIDGPLQARHENCVCRHSEHRQIRQCIWPMSLIRLWKALCSMKKWITSRSYMHSTFGNHECLHSSLLILGPVCTSAQRKIGSAFGTATFCNSKGFKFRSVRQKANFAFNFSSIVS